MAHGDVPRHLWFAVSDVTSDERFVFVNVSTKLSGSAKECVIQKAEHPSLGAAKSYLRTDHACLTSLPKFNQALAKGLFQQTANMSPDLLRKIQQALIGSPLTRREVREVLIGQGLPK